MLAYNKPTESTARLLRVTTDRYGENQLNTFLDKNGNCHREQMVISQSINQSIFNVA